MQECGIAVNDAIVYEVMAVLSAGASQCKLKPGKKGPNCHPNRSTVLFGIHVGLNPLLCKWNVL